MWCGTFHAIGARMLRVARAPRRPHAELHDLRRGRHARRRSSASWSGVGISPKQCTPQAIARARSPTRRTRSSRPTSTQTLAMDPFSRAAAPVYRELERALRQANAVDVRRPARAAGAASSSENQRRARAATASGSSYILVDEYQDTNRAQYQLHQAARRRARQRRRSSATTTSRSTAGAAPTSGTSSTSRRTSRARRSCGSRRTTARRRRSSSSRTPRSAPTRSARGRRCARRAAAASASRSSAALDERDEADFVVEEIARAAARGRRRCTLRDFAILYRTNAQSRALEEALRTPRVPYRLVGAVRFYDRREIRDLMATSSSSRTRPTTRRSAARSRVPKRGLGDTTIDSARPRRAPAGVPLLAAARRGPISSRRCARPRAPRSREFAALDRAAPRAAREAARRRAAARARRRDPLRRPPPRRGPETARTASTTCASSSTGAAETVADEGGEVGLTPLDHFLQRATLVAGVDALDPDADAVTLMTLHNAKGLEFPVVFITGLEDGLFPLAQRVRRSRRCSRRSAGSSTSASRAPSEKLYHHARRAAPAERRAHAVACRRASSSRFPRTCSSSA